MNRPQDPGPPVATMAAILAQSGIRFDQSERDLDADAIRLLNHKGFRSGDIIAGVDAAIRQARALRAEKVI